MLITKESFADIFSNQPDIDAVPHNGTNPPYVGMGNPNSSLLVVGNEKALNKEDDQPIINHELLNNWNHWYDILNNHNDLIDPFNIELMNRPVSMNGFNPFNPLLFAPTLERVQGIGGHTYYGLQRLINAYENEGPITGLFETSFANNTFSKCFMTEMSANPSRTTKKAGFNSADFFTSSRYCFMTGIAASFYQGFKTTILYCGRNRKYVGNPDSEERLKIIRIFNPKLEHEHRRIVVFGEKNIEYYDTDNGARVILCRHLSNGFGNADAKAVANCMKFKLTL